MKFLHTYANYVKLEHTLFSLPLLYAGAFIAEKKWPSFSTTLLLLIAAAGARVVAMSLNRIIDKAIDAKNPRTQNRALVTGEMTLAQAWGTTVVALLFYLLAAWVLSPLCLKLSAIPLAGFVLYPYLKRWTKWTHLGLGFVWSLVPLAGFIAVRPLLSNSVPVLFLGVFSIFWLAGFDIIYSTLDEEFDQQAGLFSLPAAWGSKKALRLAGIFHLIGFISLVLLYVSCFSGTLTVMLLGIVGMLLFLEQYFSQYVDFAFFQINAVIGFAVLLFVMAGIKGV